MKLSILANSKGVLNKTIDVDENGKLLKNHPDPMFFGTIQHRNISLSELPNGLSKLNGNHAFVHGVVRGSKDKDKHIVVSVKEHNTNPENGRISRSLDCIEYKGEHISMLDHDPDEQCPHEYLPPHELLTLLSKIDSQWEQAEHCIVQSTSAGISLDGDPVSVSNPGYHLYFGASNAETLNEYMKAIFKNTIISGHGWVKLSSNGAMNIRSCFDGSVFSPERIDFTAAPTLKSGRLTQHRPAPKYYPGNPIDCSKVPEVDEVKYQELVKALKNDQEIVRCSDELAGHKATAISKERNISVEKARKLITSQIGGDLLPDDIINFQKFGNISAAETLTDLNKYDLEPCADPGEPEYGTAKAIFYGNNGVKPIIHSVLHWGKNFFLQTEDYDDAKWVVTDLEFYIPRIATSECVASDKTRFINDIVTNIDQEDSIGWDIIKKLIKRCFDINMSAIDAVVKNHQMSVPDSNGEDKRTHAELTTDFIKDHLPHNPYAVGCEGAFWVYNSDSGLYEEKLLPKIEVQIGRVFSGNYCKRGGDYKAISRLVYNETLQENFFEAPQYGVACKTSYISIMGGELVKQGYTHQLRQRHKLTIDPMQGDCPLFTAYLNDTFAGNEQIEQTILLQEILGGLVTGCFYKLQKAVLLHGAGENGKSVLLELLDCFFPRHLKSAISPADFGGEYNRAQLAGKVVNIVGELEQTKALPAASFKDIIGCDTPLTARLPYKEPFSFKPIAGHIFSSNHFPQTKDHTHGFYRRWVVLDFHNRVDPQKKIPNLGALIAEKESPQVLAWALLGADRLITNDFKLSLTKKHKKMMELWQVQKDSVYCFIYDDEEVEHNTNVTTLKTGFYEAYRDYCGECGLKPVGRNNFYERCMTRLGEVKIQGSRHFTGVRLIEKRAWNG